MIEEDEDENDVDNAKLNDVEELDEDNRSQPKIHDSLSPFTLQTSYEIQSRTSNETILRCS